MGWDFVNGGSMDEMLLRRCAQLSLMVDANFLQESVSMVVTRW